MIEEKYCECCGKILSGLPWVTKCRKCAALERLKKIQDAINTADPDEEVDTYSDEYVICPYCGNAMDTCCGYVDFPEIYEEGEHEIECFECEKTFVLHTEVFYSWETNKKQEDF